MHGRFSIIGARARAAPLSLRLWGQGRKIHSLCPLHPIPICNLVVTQSMKRYQVLVHSFVRNQPERWLGKFLLNFLFSHRNDTSL